jgi:cytoskeletal protein RodZ
MAASIGKVLHRARTERGIELTEVERVTKIRTKFLQAMERDQWEELPGPAYARGFLATYASFLDLDEQELVERYRETVESGDSAEPIPSSVIHTGSVNRPRSVRPMALAAAGVVAAIALVLVIAVSLGGGSGDGGGGREKGKKSAQEHAGGTRTSASGTTTSASTTSTTTGSEVSLELRATDLVWVCVVDDQDRSLVAGETLSADDTRGPFSGTGFELNLGNGSVELTVNGEPVDVPALAEPVGYRVTPDGVRKLAPVARPTCA